MTRCHHEDHTWVSPISLATDNTHHCFKRVLPVDGESQPFAIYSHWFQTQSDVFLTLAFTALRTLKQADQPEGCYRL